MTAASSSIHAFLEFFQPELCTIFFSSHWLLSHITIVETIDSGERGMNPAEMTIFNPQKKIFAEPRIEPATSGSQVWYATNWARHCGNRRKCWQLAFSPFPKMFLTYQGICKISSFKPIIHCPSQMFSIWVSLELCLLVLF